MDDVTATTHQAIVARDWATVRRLLHPYLHWKRADGRTVRGRANVLAMLEGERVAPGPPESVELRDGQVYRWSG